MGIRSSGTDTTRLPSACEWTGIVDVLRVLTHFQPRASTFSRSLSTPTRLLCVQSSSRRSTAGRASTFLDYAQFNLAFSFDVVPHFSINSVLSIASGCLPVSPFLLPCMYASTSYPDALRSATRRAIKAGRGGHVLFRSQAELRYSQLSRCPLCLTPHLFLYF